VHSGSGVLLPTVMAQIVISVMAKRGWATSRRCRDRGAASSSTVITGGKVARELLADPPPDAGVVRRETVSNTEEKLTIVKSRGYLLATEVIGHIFIGTLNRRSLICAAHYEPQRSGFGWQMAVPAAPRWSPRSWDSPGKTVSGAQERDSEAFRRRAIRRF
jgi:hypothetical protein